MFWRLPKQRYQLLNYIVSENKYFHSMAVSFYHGVRFK